MAKPALPPRPPMALASEFGGANGTGRNIEDGVSDPLVRYGIEWRDRHNPICATMADGYWTPYHLAANEIERLRKALAAISSTEEAFELAVNGIHSPDHKEGWLSCDCATAALIRRSLVDARIARAALKETK